MSGNLNEHLNMVDKRLRALESRTLAPSVVSTLSGYTLKEVITYTSSGAFIKSSYPGLRAVIVKAVGGGGGGGGCTTTTANQFANGGAGGGGGYCEKFILASAITDDPAGETVTVGDGGTAGTSSPVSNGGAGGNSSFGSHMTANGGAAGTGDTAADTAPGFGATTGDGGSATGGDIMIIGQRGTMGVTTSTAADCIYSPRGGGSQLSPKSDSQGRASATSGTSGLSGRQYGMGGGGGVNTSDETTARSGGAGASGIVIVEVYY